jgi:hypothetical protein
MGEKDEVGGEEHKGAKKTLDRAKRTHDSAKKAKGEAKRNKIKS